MNIPCKEETSRPRYAALAKLRRYRRMVAAKMDDLWKQIEQLKQERDTLQAANKTMKSEAAAHMEKEKQLKQQMATMRSELLDHHAGESRDRREAERGQRRV